MSGEIKYSVRGFLGADKVSGTLPVGGVCVVTGENAQGKTSVLTALGVCYARQQNPYHVPQKSKGCYAHAGAGKTAATMWHPSFGEVKFDLESGFAGDGFQSLEGGDGARRIAEACAGLQNPIDWKNADWEKICGERVITREVFIKNMVVDWDVYSKDIKNNHFIPGSCSSSSSEMDSINKIYDEVVKYGLAHVISQAKKHATDAKRDWANEASTDGKKENWKPRESATWKPPGFQAGWKGESLESIEAEIAKAGDEVRRLQQEKSCAVSDERIKQAKAEAGQLEERKKKVLEKRAETQEKRQEYTDRLTNGDKKISDVRRRITELERLLGAKDGLSPIIECPHCGGQLALDNKTITVYSEEAEAEKMAKWKEELDDKKKKLQEMTERYAGIVRERDEVLAGLENECQDLTNSEVLARSEQSLLEEIEEIADRERPDGEKTIEQAEQDLDELRRKHKLVKKYFAARDAYYAVHSYEGVVNALTCGATGRAFMQEGMGELSKFLDKISNQLGCKVEIEDGCIFYNGRPVKLCSGSEQWRARFMVSICIAVAWKLPIVIADGFDILSEEVSEKFYGFLREWKGISGVSLFVGGSNMPADMTKSDVIKVIEMRKGAAGDSDSEDTGD